jgi:hypothetical protein
MNIENIWLHPKSTIHGLINAFAVVGVVTGVLAAQGVTLGTMGNGTVVGFVASLGVALSAFLNGALSKDGNAPTQSTN